MSEWLLLLLLKGYFLSLGADGALTPDWSWSLVRGASLAYYLCPPIPHLGPEIQILPQIRISRAAFASAKSKLPLNKE